MSTAIPPYMIPAIILHVLQQIHADVVRVLPALPGLRLQVTANEDGGVQINYLLLVLDVIPRKELLRAIIRSHTQEVPIDDVLVLGPLEGLFELGNLGLALVVKLELVEVAQLGIEFDALVRVAVFCVARC